MSVVIIPKRRQERGGTAAALAALNEVPLAREWIIATDTRRLKIGDGVTNYNDLPYVDGTLYDFASGTNTLTATFAGAPVLYDGLIIGLRAEAANTGPVTFNPNGMGADDVLKFGSVALDAGDIYGAGHELLLRYVDESSPHWELLNPAASGSGGGGGNTITRTQVAHGFSVGMPVTMSGSDWVPADRTDDTMSAELIVSSIVDADAFVGLVAGMLTLTTAEWDAVTGESGGLTPDSYYWLSAVPGEFTATQPDTGVRQCLIYAMSATEARIILGEPLSTDEPDSGYTLQTITAASSTPTATEGTHILLADTTSNGITIHLPTAVGNTATYIIKKIAAANTVTIDPSGTETIDGSTTAAISVQYLALTLVSDGTNWHVV